MKKIRFKILILGLVAGVSLQSCKKQLDLPSLNSLDASLALTKKAGIESALNSVYSILKREAFYGRDLFSVTDAMADIAFANNRSARLISENRNTANITTAVWSGAYGGINEINLTLAALPLVTDATPADVARLDGELKFMRAFLLFELVRNYSYIPTFVVPSQDRGGVVINLVGFNNPADAVAYMPSRATIAECYAQVMSDLYSSISQLSSSNRGRNYASKHAGLALGARVNLYAGNWAKADSFATAAITLTGGIGAMTNTGNYVAGWRNADHPEGIFQVYFATLAENLGVNTSLAATHTTLKTPGGINNFWETRQGQGDLMPNAFLLGQLGITGYNFNSNLTSSSTQPTTANPAGTPPPTLIYGPDIRNRLFEWGVNAGGHYVECTKWFGKAGAANWDHTVLFRWPELYLTRAEARYRMADEPGAMLDLNVIRTARIVGFAGPATLSGQALLDEILRQRMLEYAFEGHRFYDIKRYGLDIVKANPVINMPATSFRLLPALPNNEVVGNPNMLQNFNY